VHSHFLFYFLCAKLGRYYGLGLYSWVALAYMTTKTDLSQNQLY